MPERLITGIQPVREAIRAHKNALERVLIEARSQPRLDALARFAADQGVTHIERVPRRDLDRAAGGSTHQGAIAWAPELHLLAPSELLAEPDLLAVALDSIQDPQNFGAVIRSAVGVAGAAVLWGEHSSAPLSPATFRASAGAIEHARLCRVASLAGTLNEAREAGIQIVGLDAQAATLLCDVDLKPPTILVIGSEFEGMQRAVRRACTSLAKLVPMVRVDSLNASVASGVALYEAANQRGKTPS